jgi:hypothetical protein
MNFLSAKTTWTNAEFGIFKACVISYGILIGLYFNEFLKNYLAFFWIIFAIAAVWTIVLWVNKMKKGNVKV